MLTSFRKMAKWGVITVIFAFVVTIFASWGAQMTGQTEAPSAIQIDYGWMAWMLRQNDEIDFETIDRIVSQRESKISDLTDTTKRSIYRDVVDEILSQRLAMHEAEKMGLIATGQEVVTQVKSRFFTDNNGGFEEARYTQARRNRPASEWLPAEKMIAEDIAMFKVFHTVTSGVVVTPGDLDDFYNLRFQRATLRHILIRPGEFVPIATAREFYDARPDSFLVEERVHGRHILYRIPQNASEAQDLAARSLANVALVRLQSGASFDMLFAQAKADTTSPVLAETLDWFERGQMVPAFDSVAFTWPVGVPTGIIKTQFGYHIAVFDAHQLKRREPFEEVVEGIRAKLAGDSELLLARNRADDYARRLAAGESFEALARQYSNAKSASTGGLLGEVIPGEMTPDLYPDTGSLERIGKEVGNIGAGDKIILDPAISRAVFDLEVGKTSDVILSGHGFHIVRIERRRPADPALRSTMKDRIEKEYRDLQKNQLFRDWTTTLRSKADIRYHQIVKNRLAGL